MYGYIYLTENLVNFKCYIGKREKPYFDDKYLGSGKHLKYAINKYGKENFVCQPIQWCNTKNELLEAEKYWIEKCEAQDSDLFYNITPGGLGGGHYTKHSDVSKHKMSLAWDRRKIEYKESDLLARKKIGLANSIRHSIYGLSDNEKLGVIKGHEKLKKKVICLETEQIFDSIKSAQQYMFELSGLKNSQGIHSALNDSSKFWNEMHWMYLNEYENKTPEEINKIISQKYKSQKTKILCIETNEIFESAGDASKRFGTSKQAILAAINRNGTCCGYHFKKL